MASAEIGSHLLISSATVINIVRMRSSELFALCDCKRYENIQVDYQYSESCLILFEAPKVEMSFAL